MSAVLTEQSVYAAQFSSIRERLPGTDLSWVKQLRQKGMDDFLALGFPTTKLENWKYTNVAPIRHVTFEPAVDRRLAAVPELDSHENPRLVFVNGRFAPALSRLTRLNFHLL